MDGYIRAVSRQRLGKYVPIARQQFVNNATVGRNKKRAVLYVVRAEMLQARDKVS
jgi:hypothetical protein